MANFNISINLPQLPIPTVDEDGVTRWLEARLNDARNTFIEAVTPQAVDPQRPVRSRAGQFPTGQTGQLAASVGPPEVSGREGRIYSSAEYAPYLARSGRLMLGDALSQALEDRPQLDVLASAVKFSR